MVDSDDKNIGRQKPGPSAKLGGGFQRTTLYLPKPLIEWGKSRPAGLSSTVRELMMVARNAQEGSSASVSEDFGIYQNPVNTDIPV